MHVNLKLGTLLEFWIISKEHYYAFASEIGTILQVFSFLFSEFCVPIFKVFFQSRSSGVGPRSLRKKIKNERIIRIGNGKEKKEGKKGDKNW